jgi:DNA mismatch repair protein MutS
MNWDAFETISGTARAKGLSFPVYSAANEVKVNLKGLFHPSIDRAVRNDLVLEKGENITFLTGSNMAGKSSLLKSLGLSIYLSHLGFPVPAAEMETTIFNGLLTTINLPDNLNQGLSHYYSEVKRVKEAVSTLLEQERMFIIFDELFRGTNVKDAFDASLLIVSELSHVHNSIFFISTHIVELADELRRFENISFKYMDTFFKEGKPVFTYQLKEGVSQERLGMYIIEQEGIVDIIRQVSKKTNGLSLS